MMKSKTEMITRRGTGHAKIRSYVSCPRKRSSWPHSIGSSCVRCSKWYSCGLVWSGTAQSWVCAEINYRRGSGSPSPPFGSLPTDDRDFVPQWCWEGFLRHNYKYKYMGPLQSAVHMQHMYKCSTCKTYAAHVLYMQDRVGWMKIMPGKMQSIMQIAQRSGSECLPMLLCYRHRHNYHLYHDRDHRLSSFDQNTLPSLSLWFSAPPVCFSNCLAMYCAAMIRRW